MPSFFFVPDLILCLLMTAIVIGSIALLLSCVSISLIMGIKNSTHQVVWKELEPKVEEDAFHYEETPPEFNPNKRMKKEEFTDLNDPAETANNW